MKQDTSPKTVLAQIEQLQKRAVEFDENHSPAFNAWQSFHECLRGKPTRLFHPFSWFYYTRQ